MDPLSVLREYTVRGDLDKVRLVGDVYHFGDDYSFRKSVETAYRSKQGGFYTLDALIFFVTNIHMRHTDYMNAARNAKLQFATFTDRKPLQDYLEGRVATTDAIELLPPAGAPTATSEWAGGKHGLEEELEAAGLDDAEHHLAKKFRAHPVEGQEVKATEFSDDGPSTIDLIREREFPVRDRESILLCHNKSFEGVLAALLGRRDDEKKKPDVDGRKESGKGADGPMPAPNPANRYANVEEKRFWKEHLGTDVAEELGINPSQSYISESKKKEAPRMKPDLKAGQRPPHHPHHRPSNVKTKPDGPPIIIVPSASQTLLNTFNVKEFLEDGVYVSPEVKVKGLTKKVDIVFVQRKMGRERPVPYEVRDKIVGLTSKDWERVVAIFVLGKDWQFKGWPFSDRVEIFNKFMGIFLRFEDDSVESAKQVMQWNVKIINLSKHKRHQDKTAVLNFWQGLDSHIQSRKLNLLY